MEAIIITRGIMNDLRGKCSNIQLDLCVHIFLEITDKRIDKELFRSPGTKFQETLHCLENDLLTYFLHSRAFIGRKKSCVTPSVVSLLSYSPCKEQFHGIGSLVELNFVFSMLILSTYGSFNNF